MKASEDICENQQLWCKKRKMPQAKSPPIAEGFMGIDRTFKKCREVLMAVVQIPSMVVEL